MSNLLIPLKLESFATSKDNLSREEMETLVAAYNAEQVEIIEVNTTCMHGPFVTFMHDSGSYCAELNIDFGIMEINKLKHIS